MTGNPCERYLRASGHRQRGQARGGGVVAMEDWLKQFSRSLSRGTHRRIDKKCGGPCLFVRATGRACLGTFVRMSQGVGRSTGSLRDFLEAQHHIIT
jgi:hypothetical protein